MKYMLLIHQGTTPTPQTPEAWARLSADEQQAVFAAYKALNQTPGVTPGVQMQPARDRDDRAGGGRQDAHHRRAVRRDQGGDRRLLLLRGRRPRRRDRRRLASSRGVHGRRDRGASVGGVVATLEQAFREQRGRVLAALIGFLGDFDLAEEAVQEAFAIAAERWPRDGVPDKSRAAGSSTTARNRAIDRIRRDRTLAAKTRLLQVPEAVEDSVDATTLSRRAPRAHLHLLPPGARHRSAGRAHAADARRPDHRRDRARLPRARADDGPAAGAGEAQDQGGRDPVPGAARPLAARSARRGARGRLPDLQRGLRRSRPAGDRSAPARSGARRAHAGRAGGARSPGAHAVARRPP